MKNSVISSVSKDFSRLVEALQAKLRGEAVELRVPRTDAFRAGVTHELWGAIGRQIKSATTAEDAAERIENVLKRYSREEADMARAVLKDGAQVLKLQGKRPEMLIPLGHNNPQHCWLSLMYTCVELAFTSGTVGCVALLSPAGAGSKA